MVGSLISITILPRRKLVSLTEIVQSNMETMECYFIARTNVFGYSIIFTGP